MGIGIKVHDDVQVTLGEIKERLLKDLRDKNIKYNIPFDKLNKNGVKETIIHVTELGTEISVENDIISYIKTVNNKYTHIDKVDDVESCSLAHIKQIQEQINKLFNGYNLKIEKLDMETLNITLIISSEKQKARVQVLKDSFGEVYIHTIRAI